MDYDREKLKEICDGFDLLEYVGRDYNVRRHGNEYAMRCPIHRNDDTPSMFINPSKQRFYCHACHAGGTILDWLIKVEGLTFSQAVEKLKVLTGVDLHIAETASSMKFFKSLQKIYDQQDKPVIHEILPESYYDQFDIPDVDEPKLWLDEGITPDMITKYRIRIDKKSNRIMYPVYDNNDNLIGAKGRTMFQNYKVLGISKYINTKPIGTTDYFQGMHENRSAILQKNEAIIFEGIKSVMKADAWGFPNCISAETSFINDAQAKILIKMGIKDVVVAFDKDVTLDKLKPSLNRIKNWMNVYVVRDKNGFGGDKSSPVDMGEKIWKELYEERKRYV